MDTIIIVIAMIACFGAGSVIMWLIKIHQIDEIQRRYSISEMENKILLQQLSTIKEEQAYSGAHLKEVKQAFIQLEDAIENLRVVCKQEPIEDKKIDEPEQQIGAMIAHHQRNHDTPSQIKISVVSSAVNNAIHKNIQDEPESTANIPMEFSLLNNEAPKK